MDVMTRIVDESRLEYLGWHVGCCHFAFRLDEAKSKPMVGDSNRRAVECPKCREAVLVPSTLRLLGEGADESEERGR